MYPREAHRHVCTCTTAQWSHTRAQRACTHSQSVTHAHAYPAPLINPQIIQPIITTLVLIRNYLKHFPIRVYMLSRAGVCPDKPTSFIVLVRGQQAPSYLLPHTHTHIWRSDWGNQAVSTRPSPRTGGMWTDRREKEKEIKQQKTCSFSAAAIL